MEVVIGQPFRSAELHDLRMDATALLAYRWTSAAEPPFAPSEPVLQSTTSDLDRIIVSVKGGENVSVRDVRDLAGTVQREGALGGLLVTLAQPTRPMLTEAASHGFASTGLGQFRKLMVKTVAELMAGVHDEAERLPPLGRQEGFRRAARERGATASTGQPTLDL